MKKEKIKCSSYNKIIKKQRRERKKNTKKTNDKYMNMSKLTNGGIYVIWMICCSINECVQSHTMNFVDAQVSFW